MKLPFKIWLSPVLLSMFGNKSFSQKIVEHYDARKSDSLRIGTGDNNFLPQSKKATRSCYLRIKTIKRVLILNLPL